MSAIYLTTGAVYLLASLWYAMDGPMPLGQRMARVALCLIGAATAALFWFVAIPVAAIAVIALLACVASGEDAA